LDEDVCATLSFKIYYTLMHEKFPQDLDEDYFKSTGKEVKEDEHEGQVEQHASSHEEDVCINEEQKTTYETSSKITDEANDTSVLDGYISDESEKDEAATSHDDYEKMFQSVDDENPTYSTMYDAYDEGSPSVITLTHDEDSYDVNDEEDVTVPQQDGEIEQRPLALQYLEDQLLVKEEHIVQVLMRTDGAHKFIEDLMWKTQMKERQKGIEDGVTSAQLCIIKRAL
jgi:hypothetical protein